MKLRGFDAKLMSMENQVREARNAYAREWRAKNRDKIKQYNRNYWLKKAEKNEQEVTKEGG